MFESGIAVAHDIDEGMVRGCAYPVGPPALADYIGLDATLVVAQSLYGEVKEPLLRTVSAAVPHGRGRASGA
jgi:3-hydroxybutyryl-CoA dehydrogenase